MRANTIKWTAMVMAALVAIFGQVTTSNAAGLLTPKDGVSPPLSIKDHKVSVVIEDGYAITTVDQVFTNPHDHDLEAIYSFPVPEKGAVAQFTMWIDGKPVHGEVLEKKKAREVYESEKAAGRDAGVAEQDEYKTFEISVFPVRSLSETKIRMAYIQPAHVDSGMGRYVYQIEEGGVDDVKASFWTANEEVTGTFSFDLTLRTAVPVDAVRLPAHPQAMVTKVDDTTWRVHMDNSTPTNPPLPHEDAHKTGAQKIAFSDAEISAVSQPGVSYTLDQDIAVYFRHAKNIPGSVELIPYRPDPKKPGTFMMTITPGVDLKPIVEGKDWVFILDISGSMQGKYHALAEGVKKALGQMRPNDRFRIVLFNNRASELTRGYVNATADNVRRYADKVAAVTPGSGTNLFDGIDLGLRKLDADRTSAVILVTDGVANVGVTKKKSFIDLVKTKDVRFFTFIMGNSANTPLLKVVTDATHGFSDVVSNSDDIIGKILLAKSKVTHEAFHNVKVKIDGVRTADITPKNIGSLYRGQQLIIFGHYYGSGVANVTLSAKISGEEKVYKSAFAFPEKADTHPEIERLWAFASIEQIEREMDAFGENADMKQAITDIASQYGLVTNYTSMIVVSNDQFQKLGIDQSNSRRIGKETDARAVRASQQVASRRVDKSAPMFTQNRPTLRNSGGGGGGAGAIDGWFTLALLPLLAGRALKRRNVKEV